MTAIADLTGRRCAFVFAHYDDAALSAAKLLSSAAPGSIDLVNCSAVPSAPKREPVDRRLLFSSPVYRALNYALLGRVVYGSWDIECGLTDPQEAMQIRLDEHERASAMFGVPTFGLGDLDGQYGKSTDQKRDAALNAAIELVRANDSEVVVTHPLNAPHPDHARTASIAHEVSERVGIPVLTACERPYSVCAVDECARGSSSGEYLTIDLNDREWAVKHDAVECYRTQLRVLDNYNDYDWQDRRYLGVECYHGAQ